jgi:hypothetical protein
VPIRWFVIPLLTLFGCTEQEPAPSLPVQPPIEPWSGDPAPLDEEALAAELAELLAHFVDDPSQREALLRELDLQAEELSQQLAAYGEAPPARVRAVLLQQVVASLRAKASPDQQPPLSFDADGIRRRVVGWERFRMETLVSAGVFPKRYFGFLDGQGDTAAHEMALIATARCASARIEEHQRASDRPVRVSDAEIVVTFLAEGGAIIMTERQRLLDNIHPIHTLGMDDLAVVLREEPELALALDQACGTDLVGTVRYSERGLLPLSEPEQPPEGVLGRLDSTDGRWAWLVRNLSFREGVVGTALMWTWEKEITAAALEEAGREPLHERDAANAFVHSSLVYNSGALHDESTVQAILDSTEGPLLFERSEANLHHRLRLPVLPPVLALQDLLGSATYREQNTSWLAAYHIGQRYGAWQGLMLFTDHFDASGAFRTGSAPQGPPGHQSER